MVHPPRERHPVQRRPANDEARLALAAIDEDKEGAERDEITAGRARCAAATDGEIASRDRAEAAPGAPALRA
jgi:hypothetical protein